MANTAEVNLRGRFPVGTKVKLVPRLTDNHVPGAVEHVDTATTDKDSLTHFDGLSAGDQFWATAEVDDVTRAVAVQAKLVPAEKVRQERPGTLEAQPPPKPPEPGPQQLAKAAAEAEEQKPKKRAARPRRTSKSTKSKG